MKILLFDMDGVLLESVGYHLALQETVRYVANALGFEGLTLSHEDIATFESSGINKEWDEAAICTALLLEAAWTSDPKQGLPEINLKAKAHLLRQQPFPDFSVLARQLSSPYLLHLHPLERALYRFTESDHFSKTQYDILHTLINGARDPKQSLTHRIFQELVLGSNEYSRIYGLPSALDCESYLLKYDISSLPPDMYMHLRDWLSRPGHVATVITSRPSCPLDGVFSTPEAELGAELVGIPDIPIVGWGGITWLAQERQADQQTYVKPSPVHALAAMRVALGDNQETALLDAASLVETGQGVMAWQRLRGAQVSIFEDTPAGIASLQAAQEILNKLGVQIEPRYYGIASKAVKRKALSASSAQVFSTLTQALTNLI
jgi:hypothetical protein